MLSEQGFEYCRCYMKVLKERNQPHQGRVKYRIAQYGIGDLRMLFKTLRKLKQGDVFQKG